MLVDDKGKARRWAAGTLYNKPLGVFIDSDRAIAEAIKNGLKTHNFGMSVSLQKVGLTKPEIERMASAFEHRDLEMARASRSVLPAV